MPRLIAVVTAVVAIAVLLPLLRPAAASASTVVADPCLNLRAGPGTGYAVLACLPSGSWVEEVSWSGEWAQVSTGYGLGWVHGGFLAVGAGVEATMTDDASASGGYSAVTGGYFSGSIIDSIVAAANAHGVSADWLLAVAACESGYDPNAVGPNGEIGVFQFEESTYYAHGGADIWNPHEQAWVAAAMFAQGLSWHWVCA